MMKSELICIRGLFEHNLSIPDYQRPYRWKVGNAQILFDDLYASFKKSIKGEYRIGSIVLYYDNINNPNTTRLVGRNNTLIISTCSIENFPYSSIVKREMTKCYITTYYNLIYGCLIYNIVLFNKYDLSE